VANILCVVETEGHLPLPVCLEALGQARRISTRLGATLYAVVPLAEAPRYGEDDLIAVLARHGADKVMLVVDEALGAGADGMRWGTHGAALTQVTEMVSPSLLLFGATPGGREVAARAAARMGAAYLAEAWLEVDGEALRLWEGSGDAARGLDGDLEFPVVATIPPGRYAEATGDDEAEVEIVSTSGGLADFDPLGLDEAPLGRALVLSGDAPEAIEAGAVLARALGGEARTAVGVEPAIAALAISLGPPLDGVVAEARVALDAAAAATAHYSVTPEGGSAPERARQFAAGLEEPS
jgi:electron transfer flavoprotein alpha subunit